MLTQPAAVVLLFLSENWWAAAARRPGRAGLTAKLFLLLVFFQFSALLQAQPALVAGEGSPGYLANIETHSSAELNGLLLRAEQLLSSGKFISGSDTPIAFVLHGPEAKSLLAQSYKKNMALQDLAAKLSAFRVVDIKVCKTWMGSEGLDESQLPPFISTVPFGPVEARRLIDKQNYIYF